MQNSTFDSSFVNRLREMIANKYGKSLVVRRLMDISEYDHRDTFTKGTDLHIPIKMNGSLLGTAIVSSARDLDGDSKDSMTQLIRMVLEPAMYNWYLERRQSNLVELNKSDFLTENLKIFGDEEVDEAKAVESFVTSLDENGLVSHLIHLEGPSENQNKKIALFLHEITKRWAFVPFNDIKGQIHSSMDISKMGSMTIFIENIESLNTSEQELIKEYLEEEHFEDEPLLVTTSSLSINELERSSLHAHIVDELSVNLFEVEKAPLNPENLKEVLELFYLKDSQLET